MLVWEDDSAFASTPVQTRDPKSKVMVYSNDDDGEKVFWPKAAFS